MATLTFTGELVTVTCWCGMVHAIPSGLRNFQQREHDDGRSHEVYCPLGHTHYPSGESKAAKLARQLEHAENRRAAQAAAREQAEARARGQKAAANRARNERNAAYRRSAAAVCPCCHRSFKQLRRHMASKHPDFDPSA